MQTTENGPRMTFLVAASWTIGAVFLLQVLIGVLVGLRQGEVDLASLVQCQVVAFLGMLFFLLLVHEREGRLSDMLALRKTSVWLCLAAALLGLALQGPVSLVEDVIYAKFPLSEANLAELRELLTAQTTPQRIVLLVAAGLVGPVVEEMFFRGALFKGLRREHTDALTVVGVSLLFAAAHRDLRSFVPDMMGALVMGYLRLVSGSLWPSILLHVAFNAVAVVTALASGPEADIFTRSQSFAATLACVGLLAACRALAAKSDVLAIARDRDRPRDMDLFE
ncbi:MAG TPA: CPBP family intramembrane glutamic endopeptidase [Polyangiaceae bacterium]|nr:CPBP family intramembrane glutamic endopeptidase [Polyangiaceae bacterium]